MTQTNFVRIFSPKLFGFLKITGENRVLRFGKPEIKKTMRTGVAYMVKEKHESTEKVGQNTLPFSKIKHHSLKNYLSSN
jgi:hypothetical protein